MIAAAVETAPNWAPVWASAVTATSLIVITWVTQWFNRKSTTDASTALRGHSLSDRRREAYADLLTELETVDADTTGHLVRGQGSPGMSRETVAAMARSMAVAQLWSSPTTWAEMNVYATAITIRSKAPMFPESARDWIHDRLEELGCTVDDLGPARERFMAAALESIGEPAQR